MLQLSKPLSILLKLITLIIRVIRSLQKQNLRIETNLIPKQKPLRRINNAPIPHIILENLTQHRKRLKKKKSLKIKITLIIRKN